MSVTTTDLAAWLTQIWDEQEEMARGLEFAGFGGFPSPRQVLARIAADRKILARIAGYCWNLSIEDQRAWQGLCGTCDRIGCDVARLLASAYADRPGYREEWKP